MDEVIHDQLLGHGLVVLCGLMVFVAGIGTGILLTTMQSNRLLSTPATSPKKPSEKKKMSLAVELSPVKLLHRIASSFLQSRFNAAPTNYSESAEEAREELYRLLGLTSDNYVQHNINWQHVFSNNETQFWVSSSTRSGIKLRGETFVDASACSVVNWLLQQDYITGIEGLGGKIEVLSRTSTDNEITIVRKVYCKAGSGIMSSKRDFKLVTSITMQDDGTYVLATRSGPWDFDSASAVGGGGSSKSGSSGPDSSGPTRDLSKGYIRGIVYASGFILRPIMEGKDVGCEMSFGCHVDMRGTRSGRGNTANVNLILASILRVIKCIQNGETDQFNHLDGQSLHYIEKIGSWGKRLGMSSADPSQADLQSTATDSEQVENDSASDLLVKLHIPTPQLLFNASLPTSADKYKLLSVARDAANRMRAQYYDTVGPDSRGAQPRTSFSGPPEIRRETFYEQDGIVLKEIHKDYVSPFGMYSATFHVQAAPETVKELLVFRPDSIDGFLEGRSILNYLSPETYVQWMAYGALFPLQAKDLLLVTTVEPWDKKKTSRGFVIASTSIDSMCEISTAKPQKLSPPKLSSAQSLKRDSLSSSSGGEGTPKGKYIRANLRLGGYIGIPNEDGSTSLTFLVDMPLLSAQKSSAWMMRYLAQYSLTELVGRIRHAVSPFNIGTATDRSSPSSSSSLLFPSAAEGTDTEAAVAESGVGEERVGTMSPGRVAAISEGAPRSPGNFLGGGGTRTVDLGRMLAGIQRRELGVHKRCNTVERVPVPHHRRDRNNSVEYFNPAEETAAGESRSRLDSDQSVGYSTWKEVRSRANSAVSPHPTSGLDSDSANDTPHSSSIGRMSANSPVPSPASAPPPLSPRSSSHHHHQRHRHHQQQPGLALHAPDGIASAASPTTQVKEKSRSTFSMLKQSLSSKRSKHTRKAVTPTAATTLYMANIDDGDESDYKIGTPNSTPTSSPRPTVGHRKGVMSFPLKQGQGQGPSTPVSPYEEPSSPSPASFASIVPSRLRLSSRGDEEVDYGSVQRELGKISPARRPSKTMQAVQRRRSISQSQQQSVEGADPNATRSEMGGATSTRTTTSVPGHRRSLSSGDALRLVQGEAVVGNNSFVSAHLSQSINDLPAALEKHAHAELTHAAWGVYQTYFDPVRCREELGIDWQLKLNKPNIHIYSSMVSNNSWCAIKAVTVMRTTPMALVKVLLNYDRMGEYDAMFRKSQLVLRVDANTVIQRLMFKEVWPTAPRDFVVCASWRQNDDGSVAIVSRSAPDTLCPQEKGYVRGFLQVSGYLLEPYNPDKPVSLPLSCACDSGGVLSPGECKVTLLNHTELGGTLPASVINVLSTNAPKEILGKLSDIVSTK